MITRLIVMVIFVMSPTICLAQVRGNPDAEAAIKKAFAKSRESVEKRDADLRVGLYTEHAVFYKCLWYRARRPRGDQGVLEVRVRERYVQPEHVKITKEKIRFLSPDIAVVDIFEEVTGQRAPETGRELPPRSVHLTFIMMKKGKEWPSPTTALVTFAPTPSLGKVFRNRNRAQRRLKHLQPNRVRASCPRTSRFHRIAGWRSGTHHEVTIETERSFIFRCLHSGETAGVPDM